MGTGADHWGRLVTKSTKHLFGFEYACLFVGQREKRDASLSKDSEGKGKLLGLGGSNLL